MGYTHNLTSVFFHYEKKKTLGNTQNLYIHYKLLFFSPPLNFVILLNF